MDDATKNLEQKLTQCIAACNNCFDQCLMEEHVKEMVGCIRSDRECADMCTFVLGFISRQGSMKSDLLELCAINCEACAAECGKHDMDHCQACAKACRECAEACRNHPLSA